MRVPSRLIANAILVIIVVTVLPVIIHLLLYPQDFPLDNLLLGFQLGFYMTLLTGISLAAAYLLAKSYFAHGQGNILTFGSAVLMWG